MRKLDSQVPVRDYWDAEREREQVRDEEIEDDFEKGDGALAEQQVQQVLSGGLEGFRSRGHVRVLLVEDDDSTRLVVTALLRKCSYEVTPASNGMSAWERLRDANKEFDLVLTNVEMPCLSGVGLFSKMASHYACRRIPVVMMSRHDSMDIVFRCLSKGAADFLIKPVRINELKNLWQHVWRSQLSSSGSGSGSGSQTGMGNSHVGSDNNNLSGSKDYCDNGSSGLNVQRSSDNGNDNQSQMQPVQMQGNHCTRREVADAEEKGQAPSLNDQEMGHDLELATRRMVTVEVEKIQHQEVGTEYSACAVEEEPATSGDKRHECRGDQPSYSRVNGSSKVQKAIDFIGGIACQPPQWNAQQPGESADGDEVLDQDGSNSPRSKEAVDSLPILELTLKRPRDYDKDGDDLRVLPYPWISAFSRYCTCGPGLSLSGYPMGCVYGAHSLSPGCLDASTAGPLKLGKLGDCAGLSMGSCEASTMLRMHPQTVHTRNGRDTSPSLVEPSIQGGFSDLRSGKDDLVAGMPSTSPRPGISTYGGVSSLHTPGMYYNHPGSAGWMTGTSPHMADQGEVFDHSPTYHDHNACLGHLSCQQSHQRAYHHSHCHHNRRSLLPQQEEQQTCTRSSLGGRHCGSSNMGHLLFDGNNGQSGSRNGYGSNGNLSWILNNSSPSGSNNGRNGLDRHSDGQDGLSLAVRVDGDSGNKIRNSSSIGNSTKVSNNRSVDSEEYRLSHREAALNKFRQKRKERCFEKKVRYQSRKRLAEQRPRIRGQFVRQTVRDCVTVTTEQE